MTGLIHRMVQRARGKLPGVGPLVRSHQTAAAALGATIEQRLSIASPEPAIAPLSPHASARSTNNDRAMDAVTPATAHLAENHEPTEYRADSVDQVPRRNKPRDQFAAKLPPPDGILKRPPDPRDPLTLEVHAFAQDPDQNAEEPDVYASPQDAPADAQQRSPRLRKDLAALRNEPAQSRQAAVPSGPLESTIEHTEIHITIGSIELRAPQTEAPLKPAPFKPRVSLDDYLRRRSGAGS